MGMNEYPIEMKTQMAEYAHLHETKQYGRAFDKLVYIYTTFRDYIDREFVKHTENMMIHETLNGIMAEQDQRECISDEWLRRADQISPPSKDQSEMFFDYCLIQYQVALKHWMEGNYGLAKQAFQCAESYFQNSYSDLMNHREIRDWLKQIRETLQTNLEKEIIEIGAYVTNKGFVQKWIGIVVKRNEGKNALTIRITFSNGSAFRVGKDYSILQDEMKILSRVSLRAFFTGYK